MIRRYQLAFVALLALFGFLGAPARAANPMDEIALGKPDAKITIIEYFSMTCSHCATFEIETLPELRKAWIDTGKARFVFRDFPLDQVALLAAQLGRCLAADKGAETYARFVSLLMKGQQSWAISKDPIQSLGASARLAGMSKERIESCVLDKKLENDILQSQLDAQKKYGIRSTPSFVVNGKLYSGSMTFEQFDKVLKGQ